jgi:hypothetical protein
MPHVCVSALPDLGEDPDDLRVWKELFVLSYCKFARFAVSV